MAKDKGIGELSGITPSAVVGLTREGIVSAADLVVADFDRVAYIVDDYNEAARLVREAAKEVPGAIPPPAVRRSRATHHEGLGVTTPVLRSPVKAQPLPSKPAAPTLPKGREDMREPTTRESGLPAAMETAVRGMRLGHGESGAQGRAALRRRLDALSMLLEHGADEQELCAALLLEPVESGTPDQSDLGKRFGSGIAKLVEECTSLRAIPMLPSGTAPRYYMEMAQNASGAARRICAAYLLSSDRRGGAAWHSRLLAEALAGGEPDELVTLARTTVERSGERQAA
jgi:hypothetical protein